MLSHLPPASPSRVTRPGFILDLFFVEARCFGAVHRPLRLALGALASVLVIAVIQPGPTVMALATATVPTLVALYCAVVFARAVSKDGALPR